MRTREQRIRTDWASLSLSPNGHPVVCLRSSGKPRCLCFDSGEQLKQVLDRGGFSIKRWVVSVPRGLCVFKSLRLPTSDLDEAMQMVEFEVPSLIPLALEEVTYGCALTGRCGNQQSVCVWILKRDILNEYLASVRACGVTPRIVLPDTLAIHSWFVTHGESCHGGAAIQVLASEHTATVLVCEEHGLRNIFQHILSNGVQQTRPAVNVEVAILQQSGVLECEETEGHVAIAGDIRRMAHIEETFRCFMETQKRDFIILDAPRAISYSTNGTPERVCTGLSYETVVVEGLLSLLSDSERMQANLLPRQSVSRYHRRTALLRGIELAVLAGALIVLLWGWLMAGTWRLKREAYAVQAEMTPIRHLAQGVEKKRQRLDAIQRQYARRGQISQLFVELYECTPATISFYELRGDAQPQGMLVGISGQADFLPTALEYTDNVRDAELLGDLQIINAQQIPQAGGGSVVEFKASCLIQGRQK